MANAKDTTTVPVLAPWQSKTIWLNALGLAAMFIPSVNKFLTTNPDIVPSAFALGNIFLRFFTKGKVELKP